MQEKTLGSSQNCHKVWRIVMDSCQSFCCSASELPYYVWENFPPFEDLWDFQQRKWTFLMLSFPPPVQLGTNMWLRLGQADTCAKTLNWEQITQINRLQKTPLWHCKQEYQGLVSIDSGAKVARAAPNPQSQGKQSRPQRGDCSSTTSVDMLWSVISVLG